MTATLKAPAGKWLVFYGTHRGCVTSREPGEKIVRDTEQEARQAFTQEKKEFLPGTRLWFAYLYDDAGKKTVIESGEPYSR